MVLEKIQKENDIKKLDRTSSDSCEGNPAFSHRKYQQDRGTSGVQSGCRRTYHGASSDVLSSAG